MHFEDYYNLYGYFGGINLEIFTLAGLIAISKIILIDILLAGDNAVVIGMAAKNLPVNLQKKAIFWGTFGAIALRLIMAFAFVEALHSIPYVHFVGGVLLIWIALSLIMNNSGEHKIAAKNNLFGAISTIVIADGIMGIDNVLGVVAAAKGHMLLVMTGMLITVPIIVWGSTFFIKLINRFPIILYLGGAILGWAAAGMIVDDPTVIKVMTPILNNLFTANVPFNLSPYDFGSYIFGFVVSVLILILGYVIPKLKSYFRG